MTGRIECAQKFSEYHLRSTRIPNDPFCCMTLLAIKCYLLQRMLQTAKTVNVFQWPNNTRKLPPHPTLRHLHLHLMLGFLVSLPSLHPQRQLNRFSHFCTVHCRVPLLYNGLLRFPSKLPLSLGGSGPASNTWYLRPTQVINPNDILIGSAAFVW